jgi:uncharacterized membrane protein YbaN (DUF454 family)
LHKPLYKLLGFLFVGIAGAGFVLPVLPGTPFLLLAAWFFANSSPKWHFWLLDSGLFGPVIRNWEVHRCISRRTKVVALSSMVVVGGASVVLAVSEPWLRLVALSLMGVGCVMVLSIKTCGETQVSLDPPQDAARGLSRDPPQDPSQDPPQEPSQEPSQELEQDRRET